MLTNLRKVSFFSFVVGSLCALILTACIEKQKTQINIPEGFATQTLKEFARQANVEIIFDPQSVYGVKTHAVSGEHEPRAALRIMLKDTPLSVDFDEATGAYAVIRIELSKLCKDIRFFLSMDFDLTDGLSS
jgi:hypothetical protein